MPIHEAREGDQPTFFSLFFFATNKNQLATATHHTQPTNQREKEGREREGNGPRVFFFFLPTNRTKKKKRAERNMPTRGDRRGEVSITRAPPPQLRSPMQSPPGPVKENEEGDEGNRRKEVTRRRANQVGRPKERD